MNIEILDSQVFVTKFSTYDSLHMKCGTVEVTVTRVFGKYNHLNVIVHNAMQKAFRTLGTQFESNEEALNHYKNGKIRAMIAFQPGEEILKQ